MRATVLVAAVCVQLLCCRAQTESPSEMFEEYYTIDDPIFNETLTLPPTLPPIVPIECPPLYAYLAGLEASANATFQLFAELLNLTATHFPDSRAAQALSQTVPLTVLVPTDAALDAANIDSLIDDKDSLQTVVDAHIFDQAPGSLTVDLQAELQQQLGQEVKLITHAVFSAASTGNTGAQGPPTNSNPYDDYLGTAAAAPATSPYVGGYGAYDNDDTITYVFTITCNGGTLLPISNVLLVVGPQS